MRRRIRTKEQAAEKLSSLSEEIEILSYGGKVTAKSEFLNKHNGKRFISTLNTVCSRLQSGTDVTVLGIGKGSPQDKSPVEPRDLVEELRIWLQENLPHIEIKVTADTYNDVWTFRRIDTDTVHDLQPNRLKDKFRRGLQIFPTQEEVSERRFQTRVNKGLSFLVGGYPMSTVAKERGVSYSSVQSARKYVGEGVALVLEPGGPTLIEQEIKKLLDNCHVAYKYNKQLGDSGYRPDFVIEDKKLIIECDGLYWHTDAYLDKTYHSDKKKTYTELGYTSLFFRSNEILDRSAQVQSVLVNKLQPEVYHVHRVFARNTDVREVRDRGILDRWHLMGKGSGYCAGLYQDDHLVAVMQVKRRHDDVYEIARFCTKPLYSVVGGFSKLVRFFENKYNVQELHTFVDLRYGSGEYLPSLGFEKVSEHLSFQWTDGKRVFHRMRFPGNSGYRHGYRKIWDCGQAHYVLKRNSA